MARGRPFKPIDWKKVDELIMSQCTQEEISGFFDLDRNNFSDRLVREKGCIFTEYASSLRSKGKGLLRKKQFSEALNGNTRMLDKLGDIYLGQKDVLEEKPKNDDINEIKHQLMILRAENEKLKREAENKHDPE